MILCKRKGMALITVVLIAALFLISIVGISAKVITDKKVSNARASSERALVTAETGLSQVVFNLRNADFITDTTAPSGVLEHLDIDGVKAIAEATPDETHVLLNLGEHPYSDPTDVPYVTYWVKIKKTGGEIWTPTDVPSEEPHYVSLAIYSMGTVYNNSTADKEVIGRKVISTDCDVVFNKSVNTIDFGILAGGDINLDGHSSEIGGDIFANGDITSNNPSQKVYDGEAYAHGAIDPTIAPDPNRHPGQAPVNITEKFEQYTKDMAYAFKTGAGPYNGTVEGYPNTSEGVVQDAIASYLSGDEETGDTLGDIHDFYNDLMGYGVEGYVPADPDKFDNFGTLSLDQLFDLRNKANNIVYYHQGEVTLSNAHNSPDLSNLRGIIVIEGNFEIAGNVDIGDSNYLEEGRSGPEFALIVRGTITQTVGTANFYGLLYGESFTMSAGNFNCHGAIVAEGDIEITGNSTITFKDTGLNIVDVLESNGVSEAELGSSSWKEISYEEFENPPSP